LKGVLPPPKYACLLALDPFEEAPADIPREEIEAQIRHPADTKVITCAIAGQPDFIITGDNDLLSLKKIEGVRILSAGAFLQHFA
jgi:predicted nucleic acid-binding protein